MGWWIFERVFRFRVVSELLNRFVAIVGNFLEDLLNELTSFFESRKNNADRICKIKASKQ